MMFAVAMGSCLSDERSVRLLLEARNPGCTDVADPTWSACILCTCFSCWLSSCVINKNAAFLILSGAPLSPLHKPSSCLNIF